MHTNTPPLAHLLRLESAIAYAARLAMACDRQPNISIQLAAAALVMDDGGDVDEAIAALLGSLSYQAPRSGKTNKEIQQSFGPTTAQYIAALSGFAYMPSLGDTPPGAPIQPEIARIASSIGLALLRSYAHRLRLGAPGLVNSDLPAEIIDQQLSMQAAKLLSLLPPTALTEELAIVGRSLWGKKWLSALG